MVDEADPRLSDFHRRHAKSLIPGWLRIAEGLDFPSCPELDEPPAAAAARAARAQLATTRMLWAVYQDQIRADEVYEPVRRFFIEQLERRVWCEPDPVEALRRFLGLPKRGKKPKRGPPKTTAARDFFLAADIQELIDQGKTVDKACERVFGRLDADIQKWKETGVIDEEARLRLRVGERLDGTPEALDTQTLRKIYFRETKYPIDEAAVRAEVEVRSWSAQTSNDGAKLSE